MGGKDVNHCGPLDCQVYRIAREHLEVEDQDSYPRACLKLLQEVVCSFDFPLGSCTSRELALIQKHEIQNTMEPGANTYHPYYPSPNVTSRLNRSYQGNIGSQSCLY